LLILKRSNTSRLPGQLSEDYDVLENRVVVFRILKVPVALESRPRTWASGHNGHIKRVAPGYDATRGACNCGVEVRKTPGCTGGEARGRDGRGQT
jgi:hypothetical protein